MNHAHPSKKLWDRQTATVRQFVLDVVNAAHTPAHLRERLLTFGIDDGGCLVDTLFARRLEIGSFDGLDDLSGLNEAQLTALVGGFAQPPFVGGESETLEQVVWTHGTSLVVEHPERFGAIERRSTGLRLLSGEYVRGESFMPSQSWVHAAIPTATYAHGKQFHVRAVLLNFSSSNPPYGIQGHPLATVQAVELRDGAVHMARLPVPAYESPINRNMRIPVASTHRVGSGVGVSLDVLLWQLLEGAPGGFWLEISAVGVEFVTRSGGVVTAPA